MPNDVEQSFEGEKPMNGVQHASIRARVDSVLRRFAVQRIPRSQREFIPFFDTLAGAEKAGLSVADFIDQKYNRPGLTAQTIAALRERGVLAARPETVLEIGPGSGRFLEHIKAAFPDARYEIYETAKNWRDWLVATYGVIPRRTDGSLLTDTRDVSIDFLHAHKVFPALTFINSCSYFSEIARVTRPGALIVFDAVTETCMPSEIVRQWLRSGYANEHFPNFVSKPFINDYLAQHQIEPLASFLIEMKPGLTEYLIFQKSRPS